jgi:hypothetical protein
MKADSALGDKPTPLRHNTMDHSKIDLGDFARDVFWARDPRSDTMRAMLVSLSGRRRISRKDAKPQRSISPILKFFARNQYISSV